MPLLRIALASLLFFGLDRLSKVVIVQWLDLATVHRIPVWPPYLDFVMAWNRGVNFGLLGGFDARWLLVALSIVVALALASWASKKSGWTMLLASSAIIGGALGNAYDRIVYGAVADYINMSCCGIGNPYSFNVADVWIFGGAAFLVLAVEHGKRAGDESRSAS